MTKLSNILLTGPRHRVTPGALTTPAHTSVIRGIMPSIKNQREFLQKQGQRIDNANLEELLIELLHGQKKNILTRPADTIVRAHVTIIG